MLLRAPLLLKHAGMLRHLSPPHMLHFRFELLQWQVLPGRPFLLQRQLRGHGAITQHWLYGNMSYSDRSAWHFLFAEASAGVNRRDI
jgi:hypothetical protein